jgi:hypothetical protein
MSDWLGQSFIEDFGQDPRKVVTEGSGASAGHTRGSPGTS